MPAWVTFSNKPLEERITAIPGRWREVLENADLLESPLSEEAVEWWEKIQQRIEEIDEQFKKTTGENGENFVNEI